MHAKLAGRVIAGGNHPTRIGGPSHCQRNVPPGRVVAHFHRRKKAVTVDMDDFAQRHGEVQAHIRETGSMRGSAVFAQLTADGRSGLRACFLLFRLTPMGYPRKNRQTAGGKRQNLP